MIFKARLYRGTDTHVMFGAGEAEGTWNSSHLTGWITKPNQTNRKKPTSNNPNGRKYKTRTREQSAKDKTSLSHHGNPPLG